MLFYLFFYSIIDLIYIRFLIFLISIYNSSNALRDLCGNTSYEFQYNLIKNSIKYKKVLQ
jgi:hypothetical protein